MIQYTASAKNNTVYKSAKHEQYLISFSCVQCGPVSSFGIATGWMGWTGWTGWTVRGSNPGGGDFPHLSRPVLGPTQPPVQWVPCLSPGVKSGRGVTLTPQHLLVPSSRKSRAIPLLPLWAVRSIQSLREVVCTVE
jgi:hypothetical protein